MMLSNTDIINLEYRLSRINDILDTLDRSPFRHPTIYDSLTEQAQDLWDTIEYLRNERSFWMYKKQNEYGEIEDF